MIKRIFDIISATGALTLFSPILLIVALLIKKESKGPVIFKQKRPGLNNEYFEIYKFRSMRLDTPHLATDKIDASQYITKMGKFIRKTSIDELPQLMNIIKGDMSVVGPRPALYNQYDLIEKRTVANVHSVKPGLTGLAQVMGRDDITDYEKVQFDKYYVEHRSFAIDMYIIFMTVKNTITSKGIRH